MSLAASRNLRRTCQRRWQVALRKTTERDWRRHPELEEEIDDIDEDSSSDGASSTEEPFVARLSGP